MNYMKYLNIQPLCQKYMFCANNMFSLDIVYLLISLKYTSSLCTVCQIVQKRNFVLKFSGQYQFLNLYRLLYSKVIHLDHIFIYNFVYKDFFKLWILVSMQGIGKLFFVLPQTSIILGYVNRQMYMTITNWFSNL